MKATIDRNYVFSTGDIPDGMQLITDSMPFEVLEVKSVILEGAGQKEPVMRITGIFQRSDKKNANGRIYTQDVLHEAVESVQEDIKSRRVLGELDHPADAKLHMDRASHLITKIWMDGPIVMGEAEILHKLPCGEMLKALFEHKVQIGISSRGIGDMSVEEDDGGNEVYKVQPGYKFVTWDAVAEPSVPGGQLMVMESRQKIRKASEDARRQHEKMIVEEVRKRFNA
jgi:hypothetical protein